MKYLLKKVCNSPAVFVALLTLFLFISELLKRISKAFRQIIPSKRDGVINNGQNKNGPGHQKVTQALPRRRLGKTDAQLMRNKKKPVNFSQW